MALPHTAAAALQLARTIASLVGTAIETERDRPLFAGLSAVLTCRERVLWLTA
jgi:hypothetical protein